MKMNVIFLFITGFETIIGYNDIKSSAIYFYVQKNRIYTVGNVSIPFDIQQLNIGNAMNLNTGVFTVFYSRNTDLY